MQIGIDFGTTHTSAAITRNGKTTFVTLDEPNELLRSMIYVTREHEVEVGQQAVLRYLEENTGRQVITREKKVGTVENWVARMSRGPLEPDGPIQLIYDVIIDEDISSPGRLIQSVKMGLGQPDYEGTNIYDRFYTVQEMCSLLLKVVREKIEAETGEPIGPVLMGRPVRFSDSAEVNRAAQQKLYEASQIAGFNEVKFVPEPIAAASFYTSQLESEKVALIFDFGGGTLDLSIIRVNPPAPQEVLGTYGVVVGGDKFDSAIMAGKIATQFGKDAKLGSEKRPVPAHLYELLERFETIPLLSRANNMSLIRNAFYQSDDPPAFERFMQLVLNNYGYLLFQEIEAAKRRLSDIEQTEVALAVNEFALKSEITRLEFQVLISSYIADVQAGLTAVLEDAEISAENIDAVVSTGGSSLIPIFQRILRSRFPNAEQVQSDTFGSVSAGLALHH